MESKLYKVLKSMNKLKYSVAVKGLLVGALAGLLAVFYRLGVIYGTETALKIYGYLKIHPIIIFPWLFVIAAAGLFVGWLIRLEPMGAGSGVPQAEGVILLGLKMKSYTVLAVRYLGGIIGSFFGLSFGYEGPSIQIGAAGGQSVAKFLGKSKLEDNYLITGGAAAGLSAAFNAPLSGIVFALEEVHKSFSPFILISAATASITADLVSKAFFGLKPIFYFVSIPPLPLQLYLWLLPLGVVSGLTGSILNKAMLSFQTMYGRLPSWLRTIMPLLIALPCGLFLPQILGGGQNLIKTAELVRSGIMLLLVIFIAKLIFTCISFGSGVPGGIFMPILSVGALSGGIFGLAAMHFGLPAQYIPVFAVCAMAGALSSSVKAPVTSILLAAEMSGSLISMFPAAICTFIALFISDILKVKPIYEELLERFVNKQEKSLPLQEKGMLHEFPVEVGSLAAGKKVKEIGWPQDILIVSIHRGVNELVPRGNTKIIPGDYLLILSENDVNITNCIKGYCYKK